MYGINNLKPSDGSASQQSLHVSSVQIPHHCLNLSNQTLTTPYASPFSSFLNVPPLSHQQLHHSQSYQPQSQILSKDEWDLVLSYRMMKNLNVSSQVRPSPSLVQQCTGRTTSHQSTCFSDHNEHQIHPTTYVETAPSSIHACAVQLATFPFHSYTPTSTQNSLYSSENEYKTAQTQQILITVNPSCSTIPIHRTTHHPCLSMRAHSFSQVHPSAPPESGDQHFVNAHPQQSRSFEQTSSSSSTHSGDQSSANVHLQQPHSFEQTSSSSPSLTQSDLSIQTSDTHSTMSPLRSQLSPQVSLSPLIESSDQIHSIVPQSQSHSVHRMYSSPLTQSIDSAPAQHHAQTSPNQKSPISQHHQSSHFKIPTVFQFNPTITGPNVQLLDTTKPYEIGDTIKVGGRTLQSDSSSMKYWAEDDITVTETASTGYVLNMAGYSYLNLFNPRRTSHESTPDNIEIRMFKQRVRDRCRQELSSPRMIYEDELLKGKYSADMLVSLPAFYNMQAQLYRIRQQHLPASPTNPDFTLHPAFKCTDKGERFLLYDSNDVQVPYPATCSKVGRLLIYTSDLQLMLLSKSKRTGSDGTFETSPVISHQNYIIMGEFEETTCVPLVFCLCERQNYETYQLIIQIVKLAIHNLKLDFNPMYWMSDYEPALAKALKEELPNTQLLGCVYHYDQAIYRNIQKKGLQEAYQNVEVIRQILRQIMALAFLPADQIENAYYDFIKAQLINVSAKPTALRHNLRDFFKYYESHWLKQIDHFCVFNHPTRTNNNLEGYNNKMKAQLSAHPHLYKLLVWFEKEELLVQQLVMKIISDVPVYKRKQAPKTILINDALECLWDKYNAGKLHLEELLIESSKWVAKKA